MVGVPALVALTLLLAGLGGVGLVAIALGRFPGVARCAVYGLSAALCAAMAGIAGVFLLDPASDTQTLELPFGIPTVGAHLRLDPLSAFFLMLIGGIGALCSIYGESYGRHDSEPLRILPFYPVFLAGMGLVTLADDVFVFLLAWELMSLASWLMVLGGKRDGITLQAAYLYLLMAMGGTLALVGAFALMSSESESYVFSTFRAQTFPSLTASAVIVLTVIGAGAKAGFVPLHVWLPRAHPVAPSHVSALMSGVMTKIALYGLIRVGFDLVGLPEGWWGGLLLVVGGVTAVAGLLYAMVQTDLKETLAYSTIKNVGIIAIGLGLALAFRAYGLHVLAGVALIAALFHILNHALFKSLLFLGAGAVVQATGTRNIEQMGGLGRRMPATAAFFFIGSVAISALPPFNGFVSEWLTFQALLGGVALPVWTLRLATPVVAALVALSAALAAMAFVRLYGVVFLGRPRDPAAARARDVGIGMLGPMAILAGACLVLGIVPLGGLVVLRPVMIELLPRSGAALAASDVLTLVPLAASGSAYSGVLLVGVLLVLGLGALGVVRVLAGRACVRRGPAWDCGFPSDDPSAQYSAASFAQPVRRVLGGLVFGIRDVVTMPPPGSMRAAVHKVTLDDRLWKGLYARLGWGVHRLAVEADRARQMTIRHYLMIMFGLTLALLFLVAVTA